MNRRDFIKKTALLGLSSLIPQKIFAAPEVLITKEWNIAIFYPSHCASPLIFALMKGWFKEAGVKVKLVNFESMPKLFMTFQRDKDKFIAAQVPAPMVVIHSAKKMINNEPPLIALGVLGVHGSALLVREDSNIHHPRAMRNKKIATPAVGVIHNLLMRILLEKYGIRLPGDVQLVELNLGQVISKFQHKEVDAILFPEPIPSLAESLINTRNIISTQFIWKNHPCCFLTTLRHHYDNERNLIEAITTVLAKSARYINPPNRREELIAILKNSPYHQANLTNEVLKKAFRPGRSDFDPYIFKSTALLLIDSLKKFGLIPRIYDSKAILDAVFMGDIMKTAYKNLNYPLPQSDYRYEVLMGEVKIYS